jgi:hypothetical protein
MGSVAFTSAPAERAAPAMAPIMAPAMAAAEPAGVAVSLRVSGGKPLRMQAQLLAEGTSWAPGTAAWHEIALYRRSLGEFAVAIKTFKKASAETDVFHAEVFPNLDEAMGYLETFDPTADLSVDLDASDRRVSAADIALRAAALRQRTDEITRQYRALVGELLFCLDIAE